MRITGHSVHYAARGALIQSLRLLLAVLATLDGSGMDLLKIDPVGIERKIMDATVVEKTWEIPAHNGKGPVMITLRMPEVSRTSQVYYGSPQA